VVSWFSSRGPNGFYNPQTGITTPSARARVDILAPGENLTLAYYGGESGGNAPGATTTSSTAGAVASAYSTNMQGTSFASPIVAGGATLLVDVGKDRFAGNNKAIQGNVIKAVLLNSADKLTRWDNGQQNTDGVVTTTQGLDYTQGTGRMNLTKAFSQYTQGTTDLVGESGGLIEATGWDYGAVGEGLSNDYQISTLLTANSVFTGTLNWFVGRSYDITFDANNSNANFSGIRDNSFTDLDLQLYFLDTSGVANLVAQSTTLYNNTEHFSFSIPQTGNYIMRVKWSGERYDIGELNNSQSYGLAWSTTSSAVATPEPTTLLLMGLGSICGCFGGRRIQKKNQFCEARKKNLKKNENLIENRLTSPTYLRYI
jgi:hypothetical protein